MKQLLDPNPFTHTTEESVSLPPKPNIHRSPDLKRFGRKRHASPPVDSPPPMEGFADALERQFGTWPWWMLSSLFHALVIVLAMLIGAAILYADIDDQLISIDFAQKKIPPKVAQRPIRKAGLVGEIDTQGTNATEEITTSIFVPHEIEILDETDISPPNEFEAIDEGPLGECGVSDTYLGGLGTLTGLGLGGGGSGAFGRPTGKTGRLIRAIRAGGNRHTESAVDRALVWLADHQEPDGHWDSRKFGATGPKWCDTSTSGFALLAFLGAGHSERIGRYKDHVRRAIKWLISQQQEDGSLRPSHYTNNQGYANAIAGMALSEATAMGRIPNTKRAAQKAVEYGARIHQHRSDGELRGYRYLPGQAGDLSNTGWYIMQLKSSKIAELIIPPGAFEGVGWFLDNVENHHFQKRAGDKYDTGRHRYGYTEANQVTARRTAMGCLARQFMGVDRDQLRGGVEWFMQSGGVPAEGSVDLYYWYYGTLCAFQQGEELWRTWNEGLKKALLPTQGPDGSWDPSGPFAQEWGRVGQTALSALCLEVYYRYLPMYQD